MSFNLDIALNTFRFYLHTEDPVGFQDIAECYTSVIRAHVPENKVLDTAAYENLFAAEEV